MNQDIKLYIRQCQQCNKIKDPRKKPKARLGLYLAGYPLDRLAVDVMGPKPLTKDKNRYILGWLVGCFGFNDPLRQYFSLYRVVSQREGERGEKRIDESKNV